MPYMHIDKADAELLRATIETARVSGVLAAMGSVEHAKRLDEALERLHDEPPDEIAAFVSAAREEYGSDEIVIDEDAVVSEGDDGAFVMGWLFVRNETEAPTINCEHCGNEIDEDLAIEGRFCSPACADAKSKEEG